MANPLKGEVAIEIDGAPYTMVLTVNSLCNLEDNLALSVGEIGELLGSGMNVSKLRAVFWAALLHRHPMTLPEAGVLMSAFGIKPAAEAVGSTFMLAFPQEDASAPAHPPKAKVRAGTG